jgi:hypothetical protein
MFGLSACCPHFEQPTLFSVPIYPNERRSMLCHCGLPQHRVPGAGRR